jgi:hypothetical protein
MVSFLPHRDTWDSARPWWPSLTLLAPHERLKPKDVVNEEPYTDEQEYHPDEKNEPNVDAIHHLLPFGPRGSRATIPQCPPSSGRYFYACPSIDMS